MATTNRKNVTHTQNPNKPNRRQHKYPVQYVNYLPLSAVIFTNSQMFTKSQHPIHIFDHYKLFEHLLGNACYMHFRSLWSLVQF